MPDLPNGTYAEAYVLEPTGPAEQLFIAGTSLFEITAFEPPVQRATVSAVNLPDPDTFGPYTMYQATLYFSNPSTGPEEITSFNLYPTIEDSVWAGTTLLDFGGTIAPIIVAVAPYSDNSVGPNVLEGPVYAAE